MRTSSAGRFSGTDEEPDDCDWEFAAGCLVDARSGFLESERCRDRDL